MVAVSAKAGSISLKAYRGDAKTLLAFNIESEAARTNLAGFTIKVQPPGNDGFYIHNDLRFETPGNHAQDPRESAFSTINAPIHKFRWVHVPGSIYQGVKPAFGRYTYTITSRYFDDRGSLKPLDPGLAVPVQIDVDRFSKGKLALGFTRGFTQSQAFVRHFGLDAVIRPKDAELIFDTSQLSGTNAQGERFTFAQQYEWLGFTAREQIFNLLNEVLVDKGLRLDVFAYDLNEPDLIKALLKIGERARVILDNSTLHHSASKTTPEDEFEALFAKKAGGGAIKRGKFSRYAHDKIFIVSNKVGPLKVLTGSTNFSITGLYVNSNHVLVFNTDKVAQDYANMFEEAWNDGAHASAFSASEWGGKPFEFSGNGIPKMVVTFSPHSEDYATEILEGIVKRIGQEEQANEPVGSVMFAVMQLDGGGNNPVYAALNAVHERQSIFSYGISDSPEGISLYPVGQKNGVLVTGKPLNTVLPSPFNQVPNIGGVGHQVHHKFIVCGFNGPDPVVYCGSSNLALKGEQVNGDNLLAIYDGDIATVFAIEALALVDHFNFLDGTATGPKAKGQKKPAAVKQQAAVSSGWFLGTDDTWAHKYFDPNDLHFIDRELFGN
jgi:hypothetical protein